MPTLPASWDETRPDHHTVSNGGELHQTAGGTHPAFTLPGGGVDEFLSVAAKGKQFDREPSVRTIY